ncbi:GDP-L-fucose synthetase [Methylophilales bacterium HTCC2181]|uniref:GDP-L-fucose synthase n=1 Tax=Methylophilales bacterium HTCC2181 TaxID=383631 RepID=A0P7B7_9PROT|nr:GDP-L-fucose synthetase [Methylophilales bacterium HTCC2181]
MDKNAKIYVAGHRGLVGGALTRQLRKQGYTNILARTHAELDLTNQLAVQTFFKKEKPEYVFLAAAKVGGIHANKTYPAEFIFSNLAIQTNVIHESYVNGVKRVIFLGSSCIYPRDCPQPIKEEYLLTGPLELTNKAYALAKIAGVEMCGSYNRQYGTQNIAVMPTNLYGPGDNYDIEDNHVMPALIRKFHEAKTNNHPRVVIWGTGSPRREFLYSEDLAEACVYIAQLPSVRFENLLKASPPLINVGYGEDLTIKDLALTIQKIIGFKGEIDFDVNRPNGTPRKIMDSTTINQLGWSPKVSLTDGIKMAYQDFLKNKNK